MQEGRHTRAGKRKHLKSVLQQKKKKKKGKKQAKG